MLKYCCLFLLTPLLIAGDDLDLDGHFLLITQKKSAELLEDLDRAVAAGYRVRAVTKTPKDHLSLLMEKGAFKGSYKLVTQTDARRLKHDVEAAAKEGFCLLKDGMIMRGKITSNKEYVVLMEKAGDRPVQEYRVLISQMDKSLLGVMAKLADLGFEVVALMPGRDKRQIVFMGKGE